MVVIGDIADVLGSGATTFVLGVLAILVAIAIYLKQRSRKKMELEVNVASLVDVHSEARDKIEIFYEGERIQNVHLLEFTIVNAGNVAIEVNDFERALSIVLTQGASLLTSEISEVSPSELKPTLSMESDHVRLEPMLLNAGDLLQIKILARNYRDFDLDYRIAGVKRITPRNERELPSWLQKQLSLLERTSLPFPFLGRTSALEAIGLALALAVLAGGLSLVTDPSRPKSDSTIVFKNGDRFCGDVRSVDSQRVVIQGAETGRIISIPLNRITRIKDRDC